MQSTQTAAKSRFEWSIIGRVFIVLFLLYLFLVGIKVLGGSFKLLGSGFTKGLLNVSSNTFVSLLSGMLATVLVQSSSVTTSIVVGLVSSGALPFENAIPMIMGANLGTSVTNTLASLGYINNPKNFARAFAAGTVHDFFNILTVIVLLPIEMATGVLAKSAQYFSNLLWGTTATGVGFKSPIKAAIKPLAKGIKSFAMDTLGLQDTAAGIFLILASGVIIVVSLAMIVKVMKVIVESNKGEIIERLLGKNSFMTILFGIFLTISVQSSSITTSLLVPMAGSGLLSISSILPVTVGANIGTTATALLAALAGNAVGLSIAFVHLIFNLLGTLIWFVPSKMRIIPIRLAEGLGRLVEKNRSFGVVYVVVVFFLIPFTMVFLFQ